MSTRVSWRHWRTDLLGFACLVIVGYCLAAFRWPGLAIVMVGVALFCAICPRMKGPFGYINGTTRFGGNLDEEQAVILKAEVSEVESEPQSQVRGPSSSREPPED
jgi:hypothetical protein